jgi:photosystem II stability/assembly factor-like uncharacterized protein
MTDLRDFETKLRTMMAETAEDVPVPDGLADRLIAGAATPGRTENLHRTPFRAPRRWLPPLLAAAAVIIVVAGSAAVITAVRSERHVPPMKPSPSHSPTTPPPTTTPSPTVSTHPATPPAGNPKVVGPVGTPVPAGFTVIHMQFVDPQLGWAIGNAQCAAGVCATLLRTKDGGQHWLAVPLPSGLTPVDDAGANHDTGGSCGTNGTIYGPCVDHVAFADALHGYLWSFHTMFMTTDGGASWVAQHLSAANLGATSLVFAGKHVIALTVVQQCSAGCAGRLQRSVIGSSVWQPMQPGGIEPSLLASTVSSARGVAYFISAPHGPNAGPEHLYRSTDGGASWSAVQTALCVAPSQAVSGGFAPAPDGSVPIACHPNEGNSTVRVSTDGGATFGPARPAPGFDVVGASATTLLSLAQNGTSSTYTVSRSSDGGVSWHPVTTVVNPTSEGFLSPTFGYLNGYGSSSVLLTTDGGQTWTAHQFN